MKTLDWEKTLESLFINVGLSEKEARVYRSLLDLGTSKASTIITKVGFKRGITYVILYNLEKDGLIRSFQKEGKTYFAPEDPQKLLDLATAQEKKIKQIKEGLHLAMPKLTSQFKLIIGKPTIRYFEGKEGIKTVFQDIYGAKRDIVWGCVDLEIADEAFPSYIQKELIPFRIKNRVSVNSFIANSAQAKTLSKDDKKQLRKTVLLDKKSYPLPAEIDIYEDKVAILSFSKGEFIGLIIENADVAQSFRSIFSYAFRKTTSSA